MSSTRRPDRVQTGTGTAIEAFKADAVNLSPEDFEDRHGAGFLLLTAAGFKQNASGTSTEVLLLDLENDIYERTASVSVLVFPLRSTHESATHLVTVGRGSDSDVVIPDISVSRFHAFFKQNANGVIQIQDAGSSNGSTVNGRSVPTKVTGSPVDLKAGDSVRLGQMDLTYLTAKALQDFARQFGS